MTFTSNPLSQDLDVVGTAVVVLYLSSDQPDVPLLIWLEDVDAQGVSTLITQGILRAPHRSLGSAPYDCAGSLWHESSRAVVAAQAPLSQAPARIETSLQPIASRFPRGHRLRLAVSGADQGTFPNRGNSLSLPSACLKIIRRCSVTTFKG